MRFAIMLQLTQFFSANRALITAAVLFAINTVNDFFSRAFYISQLLKNSIYLAELTSTRFFSTSYFILVKFNVKSQIVKICDISFSQINAKTECS